MKKALNKSSSDLQLILNSHSGTWLYFQLKTESRMKKMQQNPFIFYLFIFLQTEHIWTLDFCLDIFSHLIKIKSGLNVQKSLSEGYMLENKYISVIFA